MNPEFHIVGKVNNGAALVVYALRLKPDIIVTDISMPILNGIEAVDQLKQSGCESRIVFLTAHADVDILRKCLSTGSFGYVLKSQIGSDLIMAINHALTGSIFVSRNLAT